MDLSSYDHVLVCFSGGKDSTAALLTILDQGVPANKIELWHHCIDGADKENFMDWPITKSYCQAFANAFNIPLYHSWRDGGFEREMIRNHQLTGDILYENQDGLHRVKARNLDRFKNTRRRFPQVSADLRVRWCSAYLKIDVFACALRNQRRFQGKRVLVVTGERGEESSARAKYHLFEPHRTDNRTGRSRRHVDHYRAVLHFTEAEVWAIIKKYRVHVHPAYYLGFSRVSCLFCIFGNPDQWASAKTINEEAFIRIADYESNYDRTIKRKVPIKTVAAAGIPYVQIINLPRYAEVARSQAFNLPIFLSEWNLPAGAFKKSCGPS